MIWKDRIKQYPHRYTLTNVSGSTYDFAEVTGDVNEAGTPVNAENLNKLIQRDGDDIKDTVTTFTEASTRANIATGESTATLFGKIKKWFTDLKPHAFNDLATVQGTETDKAPTNKLLKESSLAAVYKELNDSRLTGITTSSLPSDIVAAMSDNSLLEASTTGYINLIPSQTTNTNGIITIHKVSQTRCYMIWSFQDAVAGRLFYGTYRRGNGFKGWYELFSKDNISTVMPISSAAASNEKVLGEKVVYDEFAKKANSANPTFTGTVTVPAPTNPTDAVRLQDVMELSAVYDKVIRTQAEFEALIASPTWLDAVSVALVGQFTLSTNNNGGIKVPATVKQIHGFNSAKITVTNFVYNSSTGKGGLWYDMCPTTQDYSIRDLEVSCTGASSGGYGFRNCTNLTNCTGTGTGTGTSGYGFRYCTNLTNCTGTGTGTGTSSVGYGFRNCENLANCTGSGTGTGTSSGGYGFRNCTNLTNCTGSGTGSSDGYGFFNINYAVNCKDGGSSTGMWAGTNKNIDIDTCRKTPVAADNTTLNT